MEGEPLAESDRAMALFESNLPTRWYLPADDVIASLELSETTTLCPYKGIASYYSVPVGGGKRMERGPVSHVSLKHDPCKGKAVSRRRITKDGEPASHAAAPALIRAAG